MMVFLTRLGCESVCGSKKVGAQPGGAEVVGMLAALEITYADNTLLMLTYDYLCGGQYLLHERSVWFAAAAVN